MKKSDFIKFSEEVEAIERELSLLDVNKPVEKYKMAFYQSELEYLKTQIQNFIQQERSSNFELTH